MKHAQRTAIVWMAISLICSTPASGGFLGLFGTPKCAEEKISKAGDDNFQYSDDGGLRFPRCEALLDVAENGMQDSNGEDSNEAVLNTYGQPLETWNEERICAVRAYAKRCKKIIKASVADIDNVFKNIDRIESEMDRTRTAAEEVNIPVDQSKPENASKENESEAPNTPDNSARAEDSIAESLPPAPISTQDEIKPSSEPTDLSKFQKSSDGSLGDECASGELCIRKVVKDYLGIFLVVSLVWIIVSIGLHKQGTITVYASYTDATMASLYLPLVYITAAVGNINKVSVQEPMIILTIGYFVYTLYASYSINEKTWKRAFVFGTRILILPLQVLAVIVTAVVFGTLVMLVALVTQPRRKYERRSTHAERNNAFWLGATFGLGAAVVGTITASFKLLTRRQEYLSFSETFSPSYLNSDEDDG